LLSERLPSSAQDALTTPSRPTMAVSTMAEPEFSNQRNDPRVRKIDARNLRAGFRQHCSLLEFEFFEIPEGGHSLPQSAGLYSADHETSTCSAMAKASSTSMPRYSTCFRSSCGQARAEPLASNRSPADQRWPWFVEGNGC
jgi:hypothetical protein